MKFKKSGTAGQKTVFSQWTNRTIKLCLLVFLTSMAVRQTNAQAVGDSSRPAKRAIYLLPDGRPFSLEKWDSLEQAWGKGRIQLLHNAADDAKGIIHLVRLTDEEMQQMADKDRQREKALLALLDKPAPLFELTDLQGKRWSLKDLRGKVVVLNFWFTTCKPCIQEMPELNTLVAAYRGKDVVFLGLTFDSAERVTGFLSKRTFDYILLPGSQEVDEQYYISSWPTSIVICKKGNLKKVMHSSATIGEELREAIDGLSK